MMTDKQALDWIELKAKLGQIQIACSLLGGGFEIAVIERAHPTKVMVYIGSLREAVELAVQDGA